MVIVQAHAVKQRNAQVCSPPAARLGRPPPGRCDIIGGMIARLHGHVVALEDGAVVVDVGGVGYRVHMPAAHVADMAPAGKLVTLHTYLHVRENEMELFGAADPAAIALFRMLLTVTGIGPRAALAILSTMEPAVVEQAIVAEDVARLTEAPGIGRKTAQRIVLDLKGKLEAQGVVAGPAGGFAARDVRVAEDADAVAALLALGYTRGEARAALAAAGSDDGAPLEDRIVAALRVLSR